MKEREAVFRPTKYVTDPDVVRVHNLRKRLPSSETFPGYARVTCLEQLASMVTIDNTIEKYEIPLCDWKTLHGSPHYNRIMWP